MTQHNSPVDTHSEKDHTKDHSTKDLGISRVIVTDCGSTTTKAVLFEKTPGGWRQTFRGEAPTTVEKPFADVTLGVLNAFREVQELSKLTILLEESTPDNNALDDNTKKTSEYFQPTINFNQKTTFNQLSLQNPNENNLPKQNGVDLYLSTSSAGGGLQMVVAGITRRFTGNSAERAALGAGAIVLDTLVLDEEREFHEQVQNLRDLKPDIILLAGGTESGNQKQLIELSEIILQAEPKPRFGETLKLAIIFAGNSKAKEELHKILQEKFDFFATKNLLPQIGQEYLPPAREAIHELFLNHVMSHAPGYKKLLAMVSREIIPTPGAVGEMIERYSQKNHLNILAVDIGGATTDVFSSFFKERHHKETNSYSEQATNESSKKAKPIFNRTVSANLGMSYSVANVLKETGIENIRKWLPFDISENDLNDRLKNKMIRPTSLPQTLDELLIEQAICREALTLSLFHHQKLIKSNNTQDESQKSLGGFLKKAPDFFNLSNLDLVIGSGGVLSHAPNRNSSLMMLLDAFQISGFTKYTVDSIFMLPHLGVFARVNEDAASEILLRDCLIDLGAVIAPAIKVDWQKKSRGLLDKEVMLFNSKSYPNLKLKAGEIYLFKFDQPEEIEIQALNNHYSITDSINNFQNNIFAEQLVIDLRGRPFKLPSDDKLRIELLRKWSTALGLKVC